MAKKRNKTIDLLRGIAILLMLITHVNGFFLLNGQKPLDYISFLGATVCFSIFLFCYAFTYGFKLSVYKDLKPKKSIVRTLTLLLVYYVSAIGMEFFLNESFGIKEIAEIFTLQRIPEYTEFLLAFVLYGLIMIPIYPLLKKLLQGSKKRTFIILIKRIPRSLLRGGLEKYHSEAVI